MLRIDHFHIEKSRTNKKHQYAFDVSNLMCMFKILITYLCMIQKTIYFVEFKCHYFKCVIIYILRVNVMFVNRLISIILYLKLRGNEKYQTHAKIYFLKDRSKNKLLHFSLFIFNNRCERVICNKKERE